MTFAFYSLTIPSACPPGRIHYTVTTSSIPILPSLPATAWGLPEKGFSVFYGLPETPQLFHYFLPQAILQGKRILCLDGANRFDPLLIARFARESRLPSAEFSRNIRIARAFTCFQLTELLVRLPRLVQTVSAHIVIVTALPDLYFDEDVREREAIVSFHRALHAIQTAQRLLPVAVFTDAASSRSPRRALFQRLIAQANQVIRFTRQESALALTIEKSAPIPALS